MGCIMTPMPNHLSTYCPLFYYLSFDEWGCVEAVWERQKCGDGEVEMVRIKVEKGDMTTPSVDEEKQKRQGENTDGKKSNTVQSTGHFGTGDKCSSGSDEKWLDHHRAKDEGTGEKIG